METNMELIDLAAFDQCDKCDECQLPKHLLNYPKLKELRIVGWIVGIGVGTDSLSYQDA